MIKVFILVLTNSIENRFMMKRLSIGLVRTKMNTKISTSAKNYSVILQAQ